MVGGAARFNFRFCLSNSSVIVSLPFTLDHRPTSFWAVGLSAPGDGLRTAASASARAAAARCSIGSTSGPVGAFAFGNWSSIAISFRSTVVWLVALMSLWTSAPLRSTVAMRFTSRKLPSATLALPLSRAFLPPSMKPLASTKKTRSTAGG